MSKVSSKNPKDQNYEAHQLNALTALEKAAHNLFKDKFFHEEFKIVFIFSRSLQALSSLVSFVTGFVALQLAIKLIFGFYLSAFLAFSVCVLIEGVKALLWRIGAKWYLAYADFNKRLVGCLVVLHLVSLGFSAYGGYMLPTLVNAPKVEQIPEVNQDSISKPYLTAIAVIDNQLKKNNVKIEAIGSSSTLKTFNSNVSVLLSQKTAKEKALSLAILEAKEERGIRAEESSKRLLEAQILRNESIKTARFSCLVASLFFEVLFVICGCFCVFYLFRLNIDRKASANGESNNNPTDNVLETPTMPIVDKTSTNEAHEAPLIEAKKSTTVKKMGFVQGHEIDRVDSPTVDRVDSQEIDRVDSQEVQCVDGKETNRVDGKICALKECSNSWKGGSPRKKFCSAACRKKSYQDRVYLKSKS